MTSHVGSLRHRNRLDTNTHARTHMHPHSSFPHPLCPSLSSLPFTLQVGDEPNFFPHFFYESGGAVSQRREATAAAALCSWVQRKRLNTMFESVRSVYRSACQGQGNCLLYLLGLVLAGPIIFFCGIGLLFHSSYDSRGNAIDRYNDQVRDLLSILRSRDSTSVLAPPPPSHILLILLTLLPTHRFLPSLCTPGRRLAGHDLRLGASEWGVLERHGRSGLHVRSSVCVPSQSQE